MSKLSIGILAGMGPRSTAPFLDLLITECQVQYGARDDIDFPQIMICSHPTPFYEDRPTDHLAMETAIRDGLQHLENTGVAFLAIACNTAHIYYPQLAASVNIPLLNMVALTCEAIPVSSQKVALIAATPTIEAHIYQRALQEENFELVPNTWQAHTEELLGAIRTTNNSVILKNLWQNITNQIDQSKADIIIIACLDLSGIISHISTQLPIVDASHCLAQGIIRYWLELRNS